MKSDFYIKKILASLLILFGLLASVYSQDKKIGGIINIYKHVTAISGTNVTLENVDDLAAGDTVLLIQMKGAIINVPETGSYGSYKDFVGAPGQSEFLIIQSIDPILKQVYFTSTILKSYSVFGEVQLVRVPFYNSATVTTDLSCQPWDSLSKTGGVLAVIIGRSLALEANIDVTGKGFIGGTPYAGTGNCLSIPGNDYFSYPASFLNSGFKGESPVSRAFIDLLNIPPYFPDYSKGKGSNLTGGGGGNGRYSGGGGGSNYGFGGRGGRELATCGPPGDGGQGGKTVKFTDLDGRLFLGSGGGASTYQSSPTATNGGSGGGIIIILCDTLIGKGKIIRADGGTPPGPASGNAGAGGGGGGGSIAIYNQSYSETLGTSALTISANGGKGGNNAGIFGEGGGGGGGFILTNNISLPSNVTKVVNGGLKGDGGSSATGGSAGESITTFAPVLNGFLFNSVRSSVTGDQTDSICQGIPMGKISGTEPLGGTTPYTFLWESSTTSASAGFAPAPGINNQRDYTPGMLTQTTWFRRVVTDAGAPVLTDISRPVEIIYQPAITDNLIGEDATICFNQDPVPLVPMNSGPSGGSSHNYYLYKWIQNETNSDWNTSPEATGTFDGSSYDPQALTNTTYYQRVVTSGRCVNYSSTVTITVLPSITGNVTNRPDSVICEGSLFNNLGASPAGGGDGSSYTYQWQQSIDRITWVPAVNINNGATYIPDTSTFASVEQRYFRRVVFSGPDDVCRDNSSPILLTRYHKIKTNTISSPDVICSGTVPVPLAGSTPTQGSGIYTYEWQDSSKVSSWTMRGTGDFSFAPAALTDTTWYRRVVSSSKCTDISPLIRIDVHKPVLNNNVAALSGVSDTTICDGATPHPLKGTIPTGGTDIPGDYAYLWQFSTDNATWNPVPAGGTGVTFNPPPLSATTYYKRQVTSGECIVVSATTVKITVHPLIANNVISTNQTVCYNTSPALLTGPGVTGGDGTYRFLWEKSTDGTSWVSADGINNTESYQPPALIVPMKYKRTVRSGSLDCCSNISNVIDIGIHSLPIGSITNTSDTTICGGLQVLLKLNLTGASPWNVTYKDLLTAQETTVNVSQNNGTITVLPGSPADLNTYNFGLSKITDNNGCIAVSLTGNKKAYVYKVPVANAGPDITICGPKATLTALPTAGTGAWSYPSAVLGYINNNPSTFVTIDSTFTGASIQHKFYWEEINWQCHSKDSAVVTFYKRIHSINAGADTTLYSFDNYIQMSADDAEMWETASWTVISGNAQIQEPSNSKTRISDLSPGVNSFVWTIENGPCKVNDPIDVSVNSIFIPEGFSPNDDNINDSFVISGLDLVNQDVTLKIVNSAGAEVFSASDTGGQQWNDWSGKNSKGSNLPEGTYYYLLKMVSNNNGQVFKKSGFIILKRY